MYITAAFLRSSEEPFAGALGKKGGYPVKRLSAPLCNELCFLFGSTGTSPLTNETPKLVRAQIVVQI